MIDFDALFEDEDDIFAGSPRSKYWDFSNKISEDVRQHEFDKIIEKIAAMEQMLMTQIDEEMLDRAVRQHCLENPDRIEEHKKSLYMEYAGHLVYTLDS